VCSIGTARGSFLVDSETSAWEDWVNTGTEGIALGIGGMPCGLLVEEVMVDILLTLWL